VLLAAGAGGLDAAEALLADAGQNLRHAMAQLDGNARSRRRGT